MQVAPVQIPNLEKKVFKNWGSKNSKVKQIVQQIELYVRPGTSDCMSSKGKEGGVVGEVFYKNDYENKNVPFAFEPGDVLLDLGANRHSRCTPARCGW